MALGLALLFLPGSSPTGRKLSAVYASSARGTSQRASVAGSRVGPNSKTWKLESLSLGAVLPCLLIYSATSVTWNQGRCVFITIHDALEERLMLYWSSYTNRLSPVGSEGRQKFGALKLGPRYAIRLLAQLRRALCHVVKGGWHHVKECFQKNPSSNDRNN